MHIFRITLILSILILGNSSLYGTHNRAGEITFQQTGELSIFAIVRTYTKASSTQADKDSLLMDWGDGTTSYIKRTNGKGVNLGNNVQYNEYAASHTYPGRNRYTMCVVDPNRVAQIQNLNFPNSVNIPFSIQTSFTFTNTAFNGSNSSVILLQQPIDIACTNKTFIHKPNAYDADGDSLVFELTVPYQNCDSYVDDYIYPNEILPNNNSLSFDTKDGTIIWDSPKKSGEYNLAFFIHEYRDGVLLNSVLRDMQIFVLNCDNDPPVIDAPDEICVVAGEEISFDVFINDPNEGQQVQVFATGQMFEKDNPATFSSTGALQDVPYSEKFIWQTNCNDVSDQYYQVVFRAVDNGIAVGDTSYGLADLHDVKIKVVAPPPENLQALTANESITLNWGLPYACEITDNNFFQGFSVWRSDGSIDVARDTCNPGIESAGYIEIGKPQIQIKDGSYYFQDKTVQKGKSYCYRVVAEFAKISIQGNPYNFIQSLHSDEVCVQLPRDIPILTKTSILSTDELGQVALEWIPGDYTQFDTLKYPGPYTYQVERAETIAGNNFSAIDGGQISITFFTAQEKYEFIDKNVDTRNQGYTYRIAFYYQNDQFYDYSPTSSTIYLSSESADQTLHLTWKSNTSWKNKIYYIFDENNALIDSTTNTKYSINPLKNQEQYCFYIQSKGDYILDKLPQNLLNLSNLHCNTPIDTVPPCVPMLTVSNQCEEDLDIPEEDYINQLNWERVDLNCPNSADVAGYKIYYKSNIEAEAVLIESINDIQVIGTQHKPDNGLKACYAIQAIDSVGNSSAISDYICIEDCPKYILPNTFTPNDDGFNDIFKPRLSRFISRIEFKVYNEWGNKVFETSDPKINWDGKNKRGQQLNDGVYYYICNVYALEKDEADKVVDQQKGFIQIFNSSK